MVFKIPQATHKVNAGGKKIMAPTETTIIMMDLWIPSSGKGVVRAGECDNFAVG